MAETGGSDKPVDGKQRMNETPPRTCEIGRRVGRLSGGRRLELCESKSRPGERGEREDRWLNQIPRMNLYFSYIPRSEPFIFATSLPGFQSKASEGS